MNSIFYAIQIDKKNQFFNFKEQDKSKTIKAMNLKHRLRVAHICIAVPNEF